MKGTYIKPALKTFGDVEVLTQQTGASPQQDFLFFNGVVVNPGSQDDGKYSYFCGPTGCDVGPTP